FLQRRKYQCQRCPQLVSYISEESFPFLTDLFFFFAFHIRDEQFMLQKQFTFYPPLLAANPVHTIASHQNSNQQQAQTEPYGLTPMRQDTYRQNLDRAVCPVRIDTFH